MDHAASLGVQGGERVRVTCFAVLTCLVRMDDFLHFVCFHLTPIAELSRFTWQHDHDSIFVFSVWVHLDIFGLGYVWMIFYILHFFIQSD